jgi:hypothetical protein
MFPRLSATAMLLLAHVVEAVYLLRELLTASTWKIAQLVGRLLPRITGDFVNLQPSLWNLVVVRDDFVHGSSRANCDTAASSLR